MEAEVIDDEFGLLGPLRAAVAVTWEQTLATPVVVAIVSKTARHDFDGSGYFESVTVSAEELVSFLVDFIARAKPRLEGWQRYVEQMRRLSCPGCGDDGCGF